MGRYRIRDGQGTHTEGRITYKAGDVLESAHNLALSFPDRFEVVEVGGTGKDTAAKEGALPPEFGRLPDGVVVEAVGKKWCVRSGGAVLFEGTAKQTANFLDDMREGE